MTYLNDVEDGGETAFVVADNQTLDTEVILKSWRQFIREIYLHISYFQPLLQKQIFIAKGIQKDTKFVKI